MFVFALPAHLDAGQLGHGVEEGLTVLVGLADVAEP